MSTLVTILWPIVDRWLDFGLCRSRDKQASRTMSWAMANSESANKIKRLSQEHQFVSNNCPINVYGQA